MKRAVLAMVASALLLSCAGSREVEVPPDERFGHRFEEDGPEGRRTLDVTPPESDVRYFTYPAVIDTVHFRVASFVSDLADNGTVPVEVLVKGSLPDACSELHDVEQTRAGHLIDMRITTRKPQGAVCTAVVRPFRFYVRLEGMYAPGSYTLKLNRKVFPFSISPPEDA